MKLTKELLKRKLVKGINPDNTVGYKFEEWKTPPTKEELKEQESLWDELLNGVEKGIFPFQS